MSHKQALLFFSDTLQCYWNPHAYLVWVLDSPVVLHKLMMYLAENGNSLALVSASSHGSAVVPDKRLRHTKMETQRLKARTTLFSDVTWGKITITLKVCSYIEWTDQSTLHFIPWKICLFQQQNNNKVFMHYSYYVCVKCFVKWINDFIASLLLIQLHFNNFIKLVSIL